MPQLRGCFRPEPRDALVSRSYSLNATCFEVGLAKSEAAGEHTILFRWTDYDDMLERLAQRRRRRKIAHPGGMQTRRHGRYPPTGKPCALLRTHRQRMR